ncbi:hypothetical protein J3R82DRAFT_2779 [Butyriboletus roseoflavus]|nr:hypothetical protein J3R82DRAFT_2779 [Butyriboletus roseoflavus]
MTATFETTLAFNAIVFGIEIAAFTLLRPYFKVMYEPHTVFLLDNHFSQQIHFRKHWTEQIYNLETLWLTTKKDLPPSSFCFWFSTCE